MAAAAGNASSTLMLTDQLQDSPREQSAPAREMKRMRFSQGAVDFNSVLFQNQQLSMAATEAARSAAYTGNQLSDILKAVLPSIVPKTKEQIQNLHQLVDHRLHLHQAKSCLSPGNSVHQCRLTRCPKSCRKSFNVRHIFFANSSDTCNVQRKGWKKRRKQ